MRVTAYTSSGERRSFETDAPILLVDYDGTCTTENKPDAGVDPDCPLVLERLRKAGCTIVIWTCRTDFKLREALENLRVHGVPYDFVNTDVPWVCLYWSPDWGTKSIKPFAHYQIDDRNIGGFIGWKKVEEIVMQDEYFRKRAV